MNTQVTIAATYDHRLVLLSVVIAIFASYVALDLAGRVTATRGSSRLAWLIGGATAMGTGIWSMHYTGMLAFRLPIRVYYHVPTVLLSLLAAIFASFVALFVVSRPRMTTLNVVGGSLLMGAGIATMHYTGMAAMRLAAMHHYHPGVWLLSVLLAIFVAYISFSRGEQGAAFQDCHGSGHGPRDSGHALHRHGVGQLYAHDCVTEFVVRHRHIRARELRCHSHNAGSPDFCPFDIARRSAPFGRST